MVRFGLSRPHIFNEFNKAKCWGIIVLSPYIHHRFLPRLLEILKEPTEIIIHEYDSGTYINQRRTLSDKIFLRVQHF